MDKNKVIADLEARIDNALARIIKSGGVDGAHHKQWTLDQVVRCLTGCPPVEKTATDYKGNPYKYTDLEKNEEYADWLTAYKQGEDGPETYEWDEGIPP